MLDLYRRLYDAIDETLYYDVPDVRVYLEKMSEEKRKTLDTHLEAIESFILHVIEEARE